MDTEVFKGSLFKICQYVPSRTKVVGHRIMAGWMFHIIERTCGKATAEQEESWTTEHEFCFSSYYQLTGVNHLLSSNPI